MSDKVIKALNDGRSREIAAIETYMLQHYELEDAGYGKLAGRMKVIAIQEMKHAEKLAERILFLGGVPTTKPDGKIKQGLDIAESLQVDIELESEAVAMYNASAKLCAEENDIVSKSIFEELLAEEEVHLDEFQNTLNHVKKLGSAYLATLLD